MIFSFSIIKVIYDGMKDYIVPLPPPTTTTTAVSTEYSCFKQTNIYVTVGEQKIEIEHKSERFIFI